MQFDFQINRILTYGDKACVEAEVIGASGRITDMKSWFTEWYRLGGKAQGEGRFLHAGYYYRLAEFFLTERDEFKQRSYERSVSNFHRAMSRDESVRTVHVPYEGTTMKVHIYEAAKEKSSMVVFGGYDSFIEEFYLSIKEICESGYTVYVFEGPGQGESLKKGLKFEHEWEKPVSVILDFFNLADITVIGISWGGYFALRAAAFEKRITKVVAYDILHDGFDCMTNPFPPLVKLPVKILFALRQKRIINALIRGLMKKKLIIDWAVSHGQYITGTGNPYDFYMNLKKHTLKGLEDEIGCDVLLLAGEKDHYIPLRHYHTLMKKITRANSLTGRVFTKAEGGEQHCQIGNHGIAIEYIRTWIEEKSAV